MKSTLLQLANHMNDYFNEYICMFLVFFLIFILIEFIFKLLKRLYNRLKPQKSIKITTVTPKVILNSKKKAIGDP